jgi:hypothetical protein
VISETDTIVIAGGNPMNLASLSSDFYTLWHTVNADGDSNVFCKTQQWVSNIKPITPQRTVFYN